MLLKAPTARSRSLVKAVTWRFVGSLDTFVLSFIIPTLFGLSVKKSAEVALSIALVETLTKILLFYLHERAWARVGWGRADKVMAASGPKAISVPQRKASESQGAV